MVTSDAKEKNWENGDVVRAGMMGYIHHPPDKDGFYVIHLSSWLALRRVHGRDLEDEGEGVWTMGV